MKTPYFLFLFVAAASAGIMRDVVGPVMPFNQIEGRITNGEIAERGQFPYQAGVSVIYGKESGWCGGTLINNRWVLTAAHCTLGADGAIIYLGAWDIMNENEKGQQRIYVSKENIVVHPDYDPNLLVHDISLIKLPIEVEFNELIQPATLPKMNGKYSNYEGNLVWASGWGKESDATETVSQFLRFVKVPVLKQSVCNRYFFGRVSDDMICISTKGKKSTCNGDSGGPLVYKDNDVNYVIGATSFGIMLGCEKGFPGVFTRVTSYLEWIKDVSGVVNN